MQVSPLCPEAHNVLAQLSSSCEEALQHYRRGEEVGLQVWLLPVSLFAGLPTVPGPVVPQQGWCWAGAARAAGL